MGERTEHKPGTFSWADLATTDPDGAKRFYGELFGWQAEDVPTGGAGVYSMCRLNGSDVAAISAQQDQEREMGIPPHWNNYVTVASVDDAAARAKELGANVMAEPFDVMDVGRMAVIQDPTGAVLCLWEARGNIGATRVNEPGCLTWNDLNTGDLEGAREFYEGLFGWRFEKIPTDEVDYWVIYNGDRSNGGLNRPREEGIPSFWTPYFGVESVEETKQRAESLGGRCFLGPMTVPAGTFAVLGDPAGAVFAVFEGEFDD